MASQLPPSPKRHNTGFYSKLRQGACWISDREICFLLLSAPPLLFPGSGRAVFLALIPLLWLVRYIGYRSFLPRTPLDWPLLLLLVMVLISMWVTPDLLFSMPKITTLILGIALYYAIVSLVQRSRAEATAHWTVIAPLGIAVAIAGLGLIGTNWGQKFPILTRVAALLPHIDYNLPGSPKEGFNPNQVAGALTFVLPLLLLLCWNAFRKRYLFVGGEVMERVLLWVVTGLVGLTLLITQSRAAYIGVLAGTGCLIVAGIRRSHVRIFFITLLVLLTSAVVIMLLEGGQNLFAVETRPQAIISLHARVEIWSRALYAIQDFPFTGVGIGMFRRVMPVLYPTFVLPPGVDLGHAHNHLLAAATDLGIPGLIAYLSLWVGAGVMGWQAWHRTMSVRCRTLVLGLSAGMISHFVWGMVDATALGSKPGLLFWLMLASMASLHYAITIEHDDPQKWTGNV